MNRFFKNSLLEIKDICIPLYKILIPFIFIIKILEEIGIVKIISNIFGVAPGIFISVSLVSGISSKIEEGHPFNLELLSDPKVSIPLTALGVLVLVVNFIKHKFFKSKI